MIKPSRPEIGGSTTLRFMDEDIPSRPPAPSRWYRICVRCGSDFAEPIRDGRLAGGQRVVIAHCRTSDISQWLHRSFGAELNSAGFATRELYPRVCRGPRTFASPRRLVATGPTPLALTFTKSPSDQESTSARVCPVSDRADRTVPAAVWVKGPSFPQSGVRVHENR